MTTRKSIYKKKRRTAKKGGCGCSSSHSKSIFSGGRKRKSIRGGGALGPASLSNYDPTNQYTYPFLMSQKTH